MSVVHLTAAAALKSVADADGWPVGKSTPFMCPYPNCRTLAVHHWGHVRTLTIYPGGNMMHTREVNASVIVCARCEACSQEVVFINNVMVRPETSEAPPPASDIPGEIVDEYEEAARVLPMSPRGAAALLRLAVQKLLPVIGAKPDDINKMIGELVANGTINAGIQQALDSVRIIGNEAVHPGVLDLKDDQQTAISLFNLINFIVEKAITEPKEIAAIYAGLPPGKLAGIAQRDAPKKKT